MLNPCKDCTKRSIYCHVDCADYKKFLENNKRIKAERDKLKLPSRQQTKHISRIFRKGKY